MKKVLLIIALAFLFSGCTAEPSNDSEYAVISPMRQQGDMTVFELAYEDYYRFIQDPDMDFLLDKHEVFELYRVSSNPGKPVEFIRILEDAIADTCHREGLVRIGALDSFPVYKKTIEFMGSIDSVQAFMTEQGIDCTVIEPIVIVSSKEDSKIVWVRCADSSYFLTIDEYPEEDLGPPPWDGECVYRVYTPQEWAEKTNAQKRLDDLKRPWRIAAILAVSIVIVILCLVIVFMLRYRKIRENRKDAYLSRFKGEERKTEDGSLS